MRIKRTGRRGGRHAHPPGSDGSTVEELAAQLAPPEERDAQAGARDGDGANHGGAIVVDSSAIKMPEGFGAAKRESRFEIARVVLVVTLLMLLFAAFVAWQITLMPDDRDEPQPVRVVGPGGGG